MAKFYKNPKTGKEMVLLTPSEQVHKYGIELHNGVRMTNRGVVKRDKETKEILVLDKNQSAYRSGFIAHATAQRKAFKAKNPNYKRTTKNTKKGVYSVTVGYKDGTVERYVNGIKK